MDPEGPPHSRQYPVNTEFFDFFGPSGHCLPLRASLAKMKRQRVQHDRNDGFSGAGAGRERNGRGCPPRFGQGDTFGDADRNCSGFDNLEDRRSCRTQGQNGPDEEITT